MFKFWKLKKEKQERKKVLEHREKMHNDFVKNEYLCFEMVRNRGKQFSKAIDALNICFVEMCWTVYQKNESFNDIYAFIKALYNYTHTSDLVKDIVELNDKLFKVESLMEKHLRETSELKTKKLKAIDISEPAELAELQEWENKREEEYNELATLFHEIDSSVTAKRSACVDEIFSIFTSMK